MSDQRLASQLAREGFQLWEAGQLEEACVCYTRALEVADPKHWALSEYHSEFAGVLAALGRNEEATAQLEKALAAELAQGEAENSSGVLVARYFLADHLTRHGAPDRGLDVLAPSLLSAPDTWYICLCQAKALFSLGRATEARSSANRAIANAPSPEKKAELLERLTGILGAPNGAAG